MKCPVCETIDLVMAERQGIEIDYCPRCRGVWLDRGELDKIIERSSMVEQSRAVVPSQEGRKRKEDLDFYHEEDGYDDDFYKRQPHKKKNWLGEVFDIFD